jgi:pimeloyl-ACP methyl ester carboxylesterase
MFPNPKFINLPDLKMAIYEKGEGVPVILCHGFPEIAFSWRHQIDALAAAGFRAIAPDMRGYGETGRPLSDDGTEAGVPLYALKHLAGDMIALLDALEIDKAIFCGHDWGGFVVWQMPLYFPDRVAGVIGVNTPFTPRSTRDPIGALRHMFGEENYMVRFQEFGVVEKMFEKDISRSMRFWYRKGMTRAEYDSQPAERRKHSFVKAFEQGGELGGIPLFTDEEMAVYEKAFTKTGYAPGINWYRNMSRNWEESENVKEHIPHPSLMICAADDVVLRPEGADGMEDYIPDLEKHTIADCGHWTQQEKPEELNQLMVDWLTKKFK